MGILYIGFFSLMHGSGREKSSQDNDAELFNIDGGCFWAA
jgi:hypothetical protein